MFRATAVAFVVLGLAGCANRSALHSLSEADIRPCPGAAAPVAPAPSVAMRPAAPAAPRAALARPAAPAPATGPLTADALARRNGLAVQDAGHHVLLSNHDTRIRLYPGSNRVSIDGREVDLRERIARAGPAVVVPAACVQYIESQLRQEATHMAAVRAEAARPAVAGARTPPRGTAVGGGARKAPASAARAKPTLAAEPGWQPPAKERAWRWVVLHHSDDRAGNAAKYDAQHRAQGWENGLGYHFVIGNGTQSGDGEVEVGGRWSRQIQGAHAKTEDNCYNEHGIGICLVGDFENHGRPTAQQMTALVHLCRWLMERYDIPLEDVKGHCDCKPTACPGKHFPWAELRARLVAGR
jgi:hypothetical protein